MYARCYEFGTGYLQGKGKEVQVIDGKIMQHTSIDGMGEKAAQQVENSQKENHLHPLKTLETEQKHHKHVSRKMKDLEL